MTTANPTPAQDADKDARIAELEAQLAEAQTDAPTPAQESTVLLKSPAGTRVHVGKSQADALKRVGFTK